MKDFLFSAGFMLIVIGGVSLGGAIAFGFNTNEALGLGVMSGVCLLLAGICFWQVHRKGGIDIWDDIAKLKDVSEEKAND